jgi:spermidine dehydrogenase
MAMGDGEARRLGMDLPIARRDFMQGMAVATAVGAMPAAASGQVGLAPDAASYPPLRTGLRGQYPGSFEVAHLARDGGFTGPVAADDTGEHYDLVVVGGGISGLSAAWFYRKALGPDVRVLVLDNHDDFGGHAKRNEFRHEGRTILAYGGTMSIETPFPTAIRPRRCWRTSASCHRRMRATTARRRSMPGWGRVRSSTRSTSARIAPLRA